MAEKPFKEYLKPFKISGKTIYARTVDDAQKQRDMEGAPRKGKAFYTKQRKDAEAKAARGDKGAKATLAKITAKRRAEPKKDEDYYLKQSGKKIQERQSALGSAARKAMGTGGKRYEAKGITKGLGGKVGSAVAAAGKALGSGGVKKGQEAFKKASPNTYEKMRPTLLGLPAKNGNGSIGSYSGPKPRAYSSLSAADKAKEDRQNERDMATKKNGAGK